MIGINPLSAQKQFDAKKPSAMYLQGTFLALSNPKAILFTTALFPQFIDASKSIPVQSTTIVATLGGVVVHLFTDLRHHFAKIIHFIRQFKNQQNNQQSFRWGVYGLWRGFDHNGRINGLSIRQF